MKYINLPIGRSGFEDIRENDYYYIDKTGLIEELVKTHGTQVTLITRPRRFGKTLAMSMLESFFDIRKNTKRFFEGLEISNNHELCEQWINQYPTVFVSFKSVDGLSFAEAYAQLASVISQLYRNHLYLMDSGKINSYDKIYFDHIASKTASQNDIKNSLLELSKMLETHNGKPVILLIDEYDVPLAKASEKNYYPQMLDMMKGLLQAFKDNPSLKFAVLTGCLRIAKESIFTGTNNFLSDTISDTQLNEYFGFTETEVQKILEDTGCTEHAERVKMWYDGYRFGNFDIYCPWDVLNYVNKVRTNHITEPESFWEHTSDNAIIGTFLSRDKSTVKEKMEILMAGGYIKETITENLTYDVMKSSEDNVWSLLYLTGYLTKVSPEELESSDTFGKGQLALKIPNAEVKEIFKNSIDRWFCNQSASCDYGKLWQSLWNADTADLSQQLSDLLFDTISYHDYSESFYHAFLTGLFSGTEYVVESNYENGLGRADLLIKDRSNRRAAVIEAKIARCEDRLEAECDEALKQIEKRQYARRVERAGYRSIVRFGMAFYRKSCVVKSGETA
ncbi:AAA family ATPase [Sporofaciens musculi]|uniref:AAA family ATPase n=1 Tax=Sporofaciens musculi TaxID=2681861 RepID=UPI002570D394|nr:AAA family ATPase [Sporofaciens musculi]